MLKIEQIYTSCLAEACYFIQSDGEIAVIDPLRDPTPYLEKAKSINGKIKYIFETHYHADFISGYKDLAQLTGGVVVFGPNAVATPNVHVAKDFEIFEIGKAKIKVLHTPGHTLESSCFLLYDNHHHDEDHDHDHNKKKREEDNNNNNKRRKIDDEDEGDPIAVFTGDTVLIDSCGRPDLAVKSSLTAEDLAAILYDSITTKILSLKDHVLVYPAHGPGSACGKSLSNKTYSTVGEQKRTNPMFNCKDKQDFVSQLLNGIAPAPQYFSKNAALNKSGEVLPFFEIMKKSDRPLSLKEFDEIVAVGGVVVLDVRDKKAFVKEHIPGSIFIGMDGQLAMYVGAVIVSLQQPIVLVCPDGQHTIAAMRLSRVGYDCGLGYLEGGFDTWKNAGRPIASVKQVDAKGLEALLLENENKNNSLVVDVRRPAEWNNNHVVGAKSYTLEYMNDKLDELPKDGVELFVHCRSGYRSVIACSILMKRGYTNLVDVAGGMDDITKTKIATQPEGNNNECPLARKERLEREAAAAAASAATK